MMENHHILCFLFVHGLKTIFLVIARHDGKPPHFVLSVCAVLENHFSGKRIRQMTNRWNGTTNLRHFCCCSSWLPQKKCQVSAFQVAKVCAKCCSLCRYLTLNGRDQLKCDGTRAETRFRLLAKRTSPFKSAGGTSVQSTTGSQGVRIRGSNAGYTMFPGSVKGTGYPLHSPVSPTLPLLCVTVCRHISTGV